MLNAKAQAEAALLYDRIPMGRGVVDALFNPVDLEKLRAAHGLTRNWSTVEDYNLQPYAPCKITLDFKGTRTLVPESSCFMPNDNATALFKLAHDLRDLWIKWGAVKHMLRWMNRNATAATIRAYWPAVMNLCPGSPSVRAMIDMPAERYTMPPGLKELLPLVRVTASTVAQMQLLGDRKGNDNQGIHLTFDKAPVTYEGVAFSPDALTFNL